ncbi:MAG: oligosaccharide flippase family protein [Desulfovibrionaceae bacterium]|nr:oligosaccharide flippase family protein [Desulfovibrionaceae bacterium]
MLCAEVTGKKFFAALCSFGCIQAAQMLLPFIALPYLARVLGLEVFGVLLYMLTLSTLLCMTIEWGFLHWGTRESAVHRGNPAYCGRIVRAVTCGKILLSLASLPVIVLLFFFLPHSTQYPTLFFSAIAYGIVWAFNPTWCFQGLGQGMRLAALAEICGGACALVLTFLLVQSPEDAALYPFLLFLSKATSYAWLTRRLYQTLPMPHAVQPSFAAGWQALRAAWFLFASRAASAAYSQGVTLVLGWLLAAQHMALLILAEKVARAVVSISHPVTQALFPEVCALHAHNASHALRLLRLSLALTAGSMLLGAMLLAVCAPWVVKILLGVESPQATAVLRAYCPLIPLLGCDFVFGIQTLIPLGQEKALTRIHLATAMLAIPLAALVAWRFSLAGAQYIACATEVLIFLLYLYRIWQVQPALLCWHRHGQRNRP